MTITNVVVTAMEAMVEDMVEVMADMVEVTADMVEGTADMAPTNQEVSTRIDSTMLNHRNVFKQGTFLSPKESQSLTTSNQKSSTDSQLLILPPTKPFPQAKLKSFPPLVKLRHTQLVVKHRDKTPCPLRATLKPAETVGSTSVRTNDEFNQISYKTSKHKSVLFNKS